MAQITGDEFDNVLLGTVDADMISGLGGNDVLEGGAGSDTLNGGAGTDVADYRSAPGSVLVDIANPINNTGEAAGDTFSFIEGIRGSDFDDSLRGNGAANILVGGLGDDSLRGRDGADVLDGGAGIDMADYRSSTIGLKVDLNNPGNNTGDAAGDTYISVEGVHGSDLDDDLTGDRNNNILEGGPGVDTFVGGKGNDTMDGGSGVDTLDYGKEALLPREASDKPLQGVYVNLLGRDQYPFPLEGPDGIQLGVDTAIDTFGDVDSIPRIPNVIGTAKNDIIYGGNHDNWLRGGEGDDVLLGGGRDDLLEGGAGTDTAIYRGNRSDYTVVAGTNGVTITDLRPDPVDLAAIVHNDGVDTVREVEVFQFADGTVSLADLLNPPPPLNRPPVITSNDGNAEAAVTVAENTTAIATVTASDPDPGDTLAYSISGGFDGNLFSIDNQTGVLVFLQHPDFENPTLNGGIPDQFYDVRVRVTDGAGDFDEQLITVTVTNANEAPTQATLSSSAIAEDADNGTLVGILTASDPDAGDSTSFTLLDDAAGRFAIVGGNQLVVANGVALDCEQSASQQITVRVTDGSGAAFDQVLSIGILNVDPENVVGTNGDDTVIGGNENDELRGMFGNDTLTGGGGNDELIGQWGVDVLTGGGGVDRYWGSAAPWNPDWNGDRITDYEYGETIVVYIGSLSQDDYRLRFDGTDTYLDYDVSAGVPGFDGSIILSGQINGTFAINQFFAFGDTYTGLTITAAKAIYGDQGNNTIIDDSAADAVILGLRGDDRIDGGAGNDTLEGGAGTDTAIYRATRSDYTAFANPDGSVTITDLRPDPVDPATNLRSDGADTVRNVEFFEFADGTVSLSDLLNPPPPVNQLPVITSNDGGTSASLSRAENATSVTTVVATDPDAGQALTYSILSTEDGGRADAAKFQIDPVSGVLSFVAAPDFEAPTDAGADNVYDVTVEVSDGNGGRDRQAIAVTVTNVAGVSPPASNAATITGTGEDDILTGLGAANTLLGLAGNDVLNGGGGGDTLDGGTGADAMAGGTGNDSYVVDNAADSVIENIGAGTDTVRTALVAYSLAGLADVENLTFTGTGTFIGTGNGLANVITGGSGNDILDGGAGNDRMAGGLGDDIYIVDSASDVVVEQADAGFDWAYATANVFTLGANVDHMAFIGVGNSTGVGNGLDNILTGGVGNDTLDGRGGDDLIFGVSGDDELLGSAGSDLLDGGAGMDLLDGGAGHDALIGGADADILLGGGGADLLDGGLGADRAEGGAGADVYIVDNALDVVVENAGAGIDEVRTNLQTYALSANVENLSFAGSGPFAGAGNGLNNVLTGGASDDALAGGAGNDRLSGLDSNDTLSGEAGRDILDGGAGNDVLTGGAGADSFVFNFPTDGLDTITDFVSGSDKLGFSAGGFGGGLVSGQNAVLVTAAAIGGVTQPGSGGYFIFDNAGADAGTVYWDATGGNGADAVAVVRLVGATVLQATDLQIL